MLNALPPAVGFDACGIYDRRGYYRAPVTYPAYRQGVSPPNKGRKLPAEPLKPREVLALIGACGKGRAGVRNRALIVTLWRSGLRISEALALYPKDVDLDAGEIRVLHGKGDQARTVGLDPTAAVYIEKWMAQRKRLGLTGRHPLFCVISKPTMGEPIHSAYVRELLKKLAVKAGVERRVHPHGLRHTHAFELANEGVPIDEIRRQLGHSNLGTTARYINHLNPRDVVDRMRARQWPGAEP
jgi:integrase